MSDSIRDSMIGLCRSQMGSPIESLMFVALATTAKIGAWASCVTHNIEGDTPDYLQVVIAPQYKVGPYAADFLVYSRAFPDCRVAVECDGHDFHERTREQAEHDKRRDREFAIAGLTVLRYTGREIYRDPFVCADEAIAFVLRRVEAKMRAGARE